MDALWYVFAPLFIIMGVIAVMWIVRMGRTALYGTTEEQDKEDESPDAEADQEQES